MSKIKIVLAILVISTILGIALHWQSRGVVAGLSNAPVDVL